MKRLLLGAALACALLAQPAHAGPSFQIASGAKDVDGYVDPGGTLHVVWTDDVNPENDIVHYCKVPRGGTTCTGARDIVGPWGADGAVDEPFLVLGAGGSTLHIAMLRYVESDAYLWTSTNFGDTWSAGTKVYNTGGCTDSTEPLLGPQIGQITFVAWNVGACVFGAAVNGSESAATLRANPPGGGHFNFAAATTGDGGMIAAADDLDRTFWWRLPPGEDPSVTANWGAAQDLGAGQEAQVGHGGGEAFVLSQEDLPSSAAIRVRKWTGAGFAPPIDVGGGETGYMHDLAVGPAATVAAVWRRNAQNGESVRRLRIARSTDRGASFATPVSFATTEGLASRLDAGLATDGSGFAVWQDEGKTVRAASLDPIAEFVPAGPGPGTTPPPGTTTPPTTTPARPLRRTVNVPGGSVTLTGPRSCVRRGGTFVATLKWKRKKRKGNLFVKVRRTDFYIGTRRVKIDRRAPFRQTLRIRATSVPGSTVRLRARAFIKVKRGRSPKKSLFVTFRVCA